MKTAKAGRPPAQLSAEEIAFVKGLVIYEDAAILALNKPPGLSSQGGRGQVHTLDELVWAFAKPGKARPRLIHRLDRAGRVRICPMQSPLGQALLAHHGFHPKDPSSWLYLDQGRAHADFDAVIHAGESFGGWGRLTSVLRLIPKPARDWLYQRLARNRYRIFGRGDLCSLPDPGLQKRLLR